MTGRFDGVRGADDLPDRARSKGRNVRDYQLLVFWRASGGEGLSELPHSKCGDDGHDVCVVAEVEVEGLVEWEGGGHGIESGVDLGGAGREVV